MPPARQPPTPCVAQPVLHGYMGSHRTLVQLATRLALNGVTTLRFDFHGVGDSAGENGAGDTGQWTRDLGTAVGELARRAGSPPAVIGLRLGATVALLRQAESDAPEVPALVLWDPVVDGPAFLDEAAALQHERFGRDDGEVLGFPISARLRADLTRLDVHRFGRPRARRVLVVQTPGSRGADLAALTARLREAGVQADVRAIDAPPMCASPARPLCRGRCSTASCPG